MNKLTVSDFFEVYANAFSLSGSKIILKDEHIADIKVKLQALVPPNHVLKASKNDTGVIVPGYRYSLCEDLHYLNVNRLILSSLNENKQLATITIEEFLGCFADQVFPHEENINETLTTFIKSAERRSKDRS